MNSVPALRSFALLVASAAGCNAADADADDGRDGETETASEHGAYDDGLRCGDGFVPRPELPADHFLASEQESPGGCPMFHCDFGGTSRMFGCLPEGRVEVVWDDGIRNSPASGGCSSNGTTFACVHWGNTAGGTLQIYSTAMAEGPMRVGSSNAVLRGGRTAVAPIVAPDGDVITADVSSVVRVSMDGTLRWQTSAPLDVVGESPNAFGPTLTPDNQIVVGYTNGGLASYDANDGTLLATTLPPDDTTGTRYRIASPPVAAQQRIYLTFRAPPIDEAVTVGGALRAYDVDRTRGTIRMAWELPHGGPSGASPSIDPQTEMILLHVRSEHPGEIPAPQLLALEDLGTSVEVRWREPLDADLRVSPASDPRGGAWAYPVASQVLSRYDMQDGLVETLSLEEVFSGGSQYELVGHVYTAASGETPALLTSIANDHEGFVIAIDLSARSLLWKVQIPMTRAQYTGALPLVRNGDTTNVLVVSPAIDGMTGAGVQLLGVR